MVEYDDGSVLAQLGQPDMRTPIANAMAWPDRIASGVQSLNLAATAALEFEPPDPVRFPCLRLAREAAQRGGTAPVVLNAANEVAVAAFLEGKLNFPGIATVIDRVLQGHAPASVHGLEDVLEADRQGRDLAARAVSGA
jgi:1-deoxy-D-xylulose-5-phosphate reductoisomerase